MAVTFKSAVQNAQNFHDTVTSYTLPALNTATDDVILVGCIGPDPSSLQDTIGNTYTKLAGFAPTNGAWTLSIWGAKSTGSNASNVITVNKTNGNHSFAVAAQYTGAGTPTAQTTASAQATGTSITSGSFNPTTGHYAFAVYSNGSNAREWTAGTSYTERGDAAGGEWGGIEDRIGLTSGAQTASVSQTTAGENLSILVISLPPSGTDRTVSGTGAWHTHTLAGKPQGDKFLLASPGAWHTFGLAGGLGRDIYLDTGLSAPLQVIFGLAGVPSRPDLLLEQSGRAFDFAIATPASVLETTPPEVVHLWGLRVDRNGRVRNPNMFYVGTRSGNVILTPGPGPRSHSIVGIYEPIAMRYALASGLLRDVSVNTKELASALRAFGFTPSGAGAIIAFKSLTGNPSLRATLAGTPTIGLATTPPSDGTTPWAPAAGDPNWTNVMTDHGAVGDGVTNDQPAFAAAAATGKKIYVPKPAAYYRFSAASARVDLKNDMYGDGQMPEIRKAQTGVNTEQMFRILNVFRTQADPLVIQGIKTDGERVGTDSRNNGEWAHTLMIAKADWVEVRYCNFRNNQGDCICIGGDINNGGAPNPNRCNHINIHHNTLYNAYRCAVAVLNCDGLDIKNNTITKLSNFVTAIDYEPNPTYSGDTNDQVWNSVVEFNTITSTRQRPFMLYHEVDGYPPGPPAGVAGGNIICRNNSGQTNGFQPGVFGIWTNVEISGNNFF